MSFFRKICFFLFFKCIAFLYFCNIFSFSAWHFCVRCDATARWCAPLSRARRRRLRLPTCASAASSSSSFAFSREISSTICRCAAAAALRRRPRARREVRVKTKRGNHTTQYFHFADFFAEKAKTTFRSTAVLLTVSFKKHCEKWASHYPCLCSLL